MSQKTCTACLRALPEAEFDFADKAAGRRRGQCKACVREYSRRHYEANRQAYIERAKASNVAVVARKRAVVAELRRRPCVDCGRTFPPCCMEFDHVSGRVVTGRNSPEAIANAKNSRRGLGDLMDELAKCDVVCRNCHAIRTHSRRVRA
jgi:hypothetical protein